MVQFGGEIVNSRPSGFHTSTQMGSGHFAGEGFGKASYFRNLQVVDWDNNLIPLSNLRVLADRSPIAAEGYVVVSGIASSFPPCWNWTHIFVIETLRLRPDTL